MEDLKGYQKKYLKGLAHNLKPVVFVGQKGMTPTVTASVNESLENRELIKVKFVDFKEKPHKEEINTAIENETGSKLVGVIGHVAIFYRRQKDSKKRKIVVPIRKTE